jgi:hypothetical protein
MAVALEWVSRIVAVSLEMFLPGIGGQYLDQRFGTTFLAGLGFVLGMVLGFCHLLMMVGVWSKRK